MPSSSARQHEDLHPTLCGGCVHRAFRSPPRHHRCWSRRDAQAIVLRVIVDGAQMKNVRHLGTCLSVLHVIQRRRDALCVERSAAIGDR